jgi:hypothetical protein
VAHSHVELQIAIRTDLHEHMRSLTVAGAAQVSRLRVRGPRAPCFPFNRVRRKARAAPEVRKFRSGLAGRQESSMRMQAVLSNGLYRPMDPGVFRLRLQRAAR